MFVPPFLSPRSVNRDVLDTLIAYQDVTAIRSEGIFGKFPANKAFESFENVLLHSVKS